GTGNARQPAVRERALRRRLPHRAFRWLRCRCGEPFDQCLGTPVGGAPRMEPQRHLAIAERIGHLLPEPQLALADRQAATAALAAPARRGLEEVGHEDQDTPVQRRRRNCYFLPDGLSLVASFPAAVDTPVSLTHRRVAC